MGVSIRRQTLFAVACASLFATGCTEGATSIPPARGPALDFAFAPEGCALTGPPRARAQKVYVPGGVSVKAGVNAFTLTYAESAKTMVVLTLDAVTGIAHEAERQERPRTQDDVAPGSSDVTPASGGRSLHAWIAASDEENDLAWRMLLPSNQATAASTLAGGGGYEPVRSIAVSVAPGGRGLLAWLGSTETGFAVVTAPLACSRP